jgi:uncharacterized protein (TIGR00369 family)
MAVEVGPFLEASPHNVALGIKFVKTEGHRVTFELPYQEKLVGNPETGVIAGGAVTSLLDATCGFSIYVRLDEFRAISTLDLRIDYLRAAVPGKSVFVTAECYHLTRQVAFVRAVAFQDEGENPIANANGVFSVTAFTLVELAAKREGPALGQGETS